MSRNKLFRFEFPGLALGGEAIVKAKTEEDARAALLPNVPYPDRGVELVSVIDDKAVIVYFNNGDY